MSVIQKLLIDRSNREMSEMLMVFAYLQNIDISYKIIERLYGDDRIKIVLLNITISHVSGDGTGFMLSIKEHMHLSHKSLKNKEKQRSL